LKKKKQKNFRYKSMRILANRKPVGWDAKGIPPPKPQATHPHAKEHEAGLPALHSPIPALQGMPKNSSHFALPRNLIQTHREVYQNPQLLVR